jgi:FMN phosphatase YigB (HAD superfamily)
VFGKKVERHTWAEFERDLTRTYNSMERLVTAYQESLISLEELRARMPELRRREKTVDVGIKTNAHTKSFQSDAPRYLVRDPR